MADNDIIKQSDIAESGAVKPLTDEFLALYKVLIDVDAQVVRLAKDLKVTLSSTTADSSENIRKSTRAYEEANKVLDLRQKTLKDIKLAEAKLTESISLESQELSRLRLEIERVNAENKKQAKEQSITSSEYEKASLRLIKLRNTWKDLAIVNKENTVEAKNLKKELDQLDATLKKIDAAAGQHQRSVGNYASGFSGLQNSINQVTRELPAFTNSVQTGFMAISNNIPMLVDQYNNLIKANKELKAQGEQTVPAWRQLVSGIVSWQTALSIGITLLTVFSKEIYEGIKGLIGYEDATKKAADAQEEFAKQLDITIENITQLNKEQINSLDFTTKAYIIAMKKRGASAKEIFDFEQQQRDNAIVKSQDQLDALENQLGEALSRRMTLENEFNKNKDDENLKTAVNNAIQAEKNVYNAREAAKDKLNQLSQEKVLSQQQFELNRQKENEERDKKARDRRLKLLEDELKLLDEAEKKYWQLKMELIKENMKQAEENNKSQYVDATESYKKMRKALVEMGKKDRLKEDEDRKKENTKRINDSISTLDKLAKNEQQARQKRIDVEIDQSKRRQDELRQLAVRGSLDAGKSLAFEERRQAELESKRLRALKSQKRQELLFAGLKAYSSNVEKNPQTALSTTLKDITVLSSALAAIPGFIEGTENVAESLGKPHLPGKDGYIVRVDGDERIVNPKGNRKIADEIGNVTNEQLIDLAILGSKSIAPNLPMVMHYDDDRQVKKLDDVKNEIKDLKNVIENRPVKDFQVDEVTKLVSIISETKFKKETTKRRIL